MELHHAWLKLVQMPQILYLIMIIVTIGSKLAQSIRLIMDA